MPDTGNGSAIEGIICSSLLHQLAVCGPEIVLHENNTGIRAPKAFAAHQKKEVL